jgi:hypothetical protein
VLLRCQQELNAQEFLGVLTGTNPEDSKLSWSAEATQRTPSTYPSVVISVTESISHSTAEINASRIDQDSILSAVNHKLNVSGHMIIWTFVLVLVCGTRAQNLSAPFSYTLHREIKSHCISENCLFVWVSHAFRQKQLLSDAPHR